MHILSSLIYISCTPEGANIHLVGTTEYSLGIPVNGSIKFHITVTSEHTYKCTGIINHTTTENTTTTTSLLNEKNMLELVFSIEGVTHHIHCAHITPLSIKEYCVDELGNKQPVNDVIRWYKANSKKALYNQKRSNKK
jgi:hypothetical protein